MRDTQPVALVVGFVEVVRYGRLMGLAENRLIDHLPDDAFFYLQTARTFARTGRWSFDGVEPASGFHVLWGYMLAGLYWLRPGISLRGVFGVAGLVEIVCVTLAAWLLTRTAVPLFGGAGALGVGIVVLSAISLSMGMCLMESSLVVLVGAVVLDGLCRERVRGGWWVWFWLGIVGMAARSDFGVMAVGLCGVFGVRWLVERVGVDGAGAKAPLAAGDVFVGLKPHASTGAGAEAPLAGRDVFVGLKPHASTGALAAGWLLVGAVVGAGLLALHTHWISGNWVQSSVRQKLWWGRVQGLSVWPPIDVLERFFYPATNWYYASHRVLHGSDLVSKALPVVLLVGVG